MGLSLVTLLLALGAVALVVGHVRLAHGATLLAAELLAAADIALPAFAAAPGLARLRFTGPHPARLLALVPPAVLLATSRVGLLGLLAASLLSAPVLAALRLGLPALPQAVTVPAGLAIGVPEFALHSLLLSAVLLAALGDVPVLLLTAVLGRRSIQVALGPPVRAALVGPTSLSLLVTVVLTSSLVTSILTTSLSSALAPSLATSVLASLLAATVLTTSLAVSVLTASLAASLLASSLSSLLASALAPSSITPSVALGVALVVALHVVRPSALLLVRVRATALGLVAGLIGIVLVGRLPAPDAVALVLGLELTAALAPSSLARPVALELGVPASLGAAQLFVSAAAVFAAIVLIVLSAPVLGGTVSVTHGCSFADRRSAITASAEVRNRRNSTRSKRHTWAD